MNERFETFTVLIAKINRNIKRIKNQEMAQYELRSQHVSCLYYLYVTQGLTATDLCERCDEDKASISRAIEYLEANGYVSCQSKSSKRYKSPLLLTEKGAEAGKRIADKIDLVLECVSRAMSEGERVEFYRNLTKISDELAKVAENKL